MAFKKIIYRIVINIVRLYWTLSGARKLKVFDQQILLTPETVFPHYDKFRLPPNGPLSEIVKYGDFVQMHVVANYLGGKLSDRPVVIDVGSHHGAYAVVCGKLLVGRSNDGKVYAIEPNPDSCKILQRNITLNGLEDTVTVIQSAVSDTTGTMGFDSGDIQSHYAQSHLTMDNCDNTCLVNVTTIEQMSMVHGLDYIDLLIIDVEGIELPVLQGIPWKTIGIGMILCELHPYAWESFNYSKTDFKNFLVAHELRCFDMYFIEDPYLRESRYMGPTFICQ